MIKKDNTPKQNVIPNPARKLNKTLNKREPYTPEHVRLGLEPTKLAKIAQSDFQYAAARRQPFVTSSKGPKESPPVAKPAIKVLEKKYPPQIKATMSGFNHEHTWRPDSAQFYDEEISEVTQPFIDEETSDEQLEAEEMIVATETIRYDDVDMKQNIKQIARQAKEEIKEDSLDQITQGQYCVIVHDKIVCVSDSLEEIEKIVEKMLFDDYSEISVDDIIVFKRLSIKAGVVITER